MFLNKIKDFWTKKIVKKSLSNVKTTSSNSLVKKVGIIFDESYFYEKEALLKELVSNGIDYQNIYFVVFKDKVKKNELFAYPVFTYSDLSWNATVTKKEVIDFLATDLDLLISYYDTEKAALLVATQSSKALFKVGFASIDKRLHHFMIDTHAENYLVFCNELFKYLKILNKL